MPDVTMTEEEWEEIVLVLEAARRRDLAFDIRTQISMRPEREDLK